MEKIVINYNVKGTFVLELDNENTVKEPPKEKKIKKAVAELKKDVTEILKHELVHMPELYGIKADFKITKMVHHIE